MWKESWKSFKFDWFPKWKLKWRLSTQKEVKDTVPLSLFIYQVWHYHLPFLIVFIGAWILNGWRSAAIKTILDIVFTAEPFWLSIKIYTSSLRVISPINVCGIEADWSRLKHLKINSWCYFMSSMNSGISFIKMRYSNFFGWEIVLGESTKSQRFYVSDTASIKNIKQTATLHVLTILLCSIVSI